MTIHNDVAFQRRETSNGKPIGKDTSLSMTINNKLRITIQSIGDSDLTIKDVTSAGEVIRRTGMKSR